MQTLTHSQSAQIAALAVGSPIRFSSAYTRLLAHELALDEKKWPLLLRGTSLPNSTLSTNECFIGIDDQKTIIRNGLALAKQPGLGLRLGSKLHLIAHGPLGVAASSAPNIAAGFDVMVRYQDTRAQFLTMQLRQSQHEAELRITPQVEMDAVGQFLVEAMAASFRCSMNILLGQQDNDNVYLFEYPAPPHAELYRELLGGECRFNQPFTEIRLPSTILARRSLFADTDLHRTSLQQCQLIQQDLNRVISLAEQIRSRIRQGQYNCSLESMAEEFNVCPRTLIRKLKKEDTSYRQIMEQELQTAALDALHHSQHSVEKISAQLGYQNVVNFRRAFQRWFQVAPGEYRRRCKESAYSSAELNR